MVVKRGLGEHKPVHKPVVKERTPTMKERVLHEFRRFMGIFLYLWVLFGLFALNDSIVLAEHHINFKMQGFAALNAFMLAKVMLVAEDLHLGQGFRDRPLVYPILYRSLIFTILLICFHIVERVLVGVVDGKTISESFPEIGGGSLRGIVSAATIVCVALIPFFGFRELGRVIGERELGALIFSRGMKDYIPSKAPRSKRR